MLHKSTVVYVASRTIKCVEVSTDRFNNSEGIFLHGQEEPLVDIFLVTVLECASNYVHKAVAQELKTSQQTWKLSVLKVHGIVLAIAIIIEVSYDFIEVIAMPCHTLSVIEGKAQAGV